MTTNFPTSLDSLTNPSATDAMDSVTVPHATQHADLNDAVEALEAKVGVDGSAVTTSLDYQVGVLPTGIVAGGYYASTDVYVGTSAVALASFTATTQTNRRYLIFANTFMYDNTTGAFGIVQIDRVGLVTMQQNQGFLSNTSLGRHAFTPMREFTGTGSSNTYEFYGWTSAGNAYVSRSGARGITFCLMDIGEV